jgi:hypothetical protein
MLGAFAEIGHRASSVILDDAAETLNQISFGMRSLDVAMIRDPIAFADFYYDRSRINM